MKIISRHNLKLRQRVRFTAWLATAVILCSGSITYAAGVTSHVLAAQVAKDNVESKSLKSFLEKHESEYIHGTFWPDAVLKWADDNGHESISDAISHGRIVKGAPAIEGYTAHWLSHWRTTKRTIRQKRSTLAF